MCFIQVRNTVTNTTVQRNAFIWFFCTFIFKLGRYLYYHHNCFFYYYCIIWKKSCLVGLSLEEEFLSSLCLQELHILKDKITSLECNCRCTSCTVPRTYVVMHVSVYRWRCVLITSQNESWREKGLYLNDWITMNSKKRYSQPQEIFESCQ